MVVWEICQNQTLNYINYFNLTSLLCVLTLVILFTYLMYYNLPYVSSMNVWDKYIL